MQLRSVGNIFLILNRGASGIVGGSDILAPPSPSSEESERATYILLYNYIASVLLNALLSAFAPLSTLVLPTKQDP